VIHSFYSIKKPFLVMPLSSPPTRTSVLINNYNNGPWLRDCVDSVLGQTRAADEVIVYDDGSTDGSIQLLRSYGSQIILIEGSHVNDRSPIASQANAVGEAFAVSTGDHIHLLDGDDLYESRRLELYEAAWRPGTVMVQAPMRLIDQAGVTIRESYAESKQRKNYHRATYLLNDLHFYYPTSALAFHRDYMARIIPFDFSSHQALAVDARLSVIAPIWGRVKAREETLSCWRQKSQSMVRSGTQLDPLASTLRRHYYFNDMARQHGFRPIYLPLNFRFLRQKARRFFPNWVSAPFVRVREGRD
jgi:glycosyltransferase involved in cell wall biosynthesis